MDMERREREEALLREYDYQQRDDEYAGLMTSRQVYVQS